MGRKLFLTHGFQRMSVAVPSGGSPDGTGDSPDATHSHFASRVENGFSTWQSVANRDGSRAGTAFSLTLDASRANLAP